MKTGTIGTLGLVVALMGLLGVLLACAPTPTAPPAPPPTQTPQFASAAPASAEVVKAFSKNEAGCLGNAEWTIQATPETWLDVGIGWVAKDGPTAQENWKHLSNVITLDGKEIKLVDQYVHGPMPFQFDCPGLANYKGAMELEIYVPPLPVGDHKVTWKTTVESDLNDGYDNYPKGTAYEFTGTIRVSTEAAQAKMIVFPVGAFVGLDQFGKDSGIEFKTEGNYTALYNAAPVIGSYVVNGTQVTFKDNFCRDRQGTYSWKLGGTGLSFKVVEDRCMDRMKTLEAGTWTKKPLQ